MAATCWWYFLAKFTEFFDTIFFNLRKKTEHVSTLHVIHHGCMPFSVWLGLKFAPGNHHYFEFILKKWEYSVRLSLIIVLLFSYVKMTIIITKDSCCFLFLFYLGGHSTFFAMLNSFVHIVMYFYYMIAAMGPQYQKFIWWKRYLTTFQMVSILVQCCTCTYIHVYYYLKCK